ncbi:MAG: Wzz/FepE/Etk N-terminal domain-containing protein [Verrucomicrobiota bacterium]
MDTAAPTETPEASLHFLDYWRVIRLRKSLILTIFLLCLITSSVLSYWLPKQYSSTVRIEVQKDSPEVPIINGSQAALQSWDPYYLTTQFRIITSWGILNTVITNLNLQHIFAEQEQAATDFTPDLAKDYLYRRVSVDQTRGTSLIEITVKNSDAQRAADIANKIAVVYKEYRKERWLGDRNKGIESLQAALVTNQQALTVKQTKLDNLRSNLGVIEMEYNPNAQASIMIETLRALENRRIDAQVDYQDHSDTLSNLLLLQSNNLLREALSTTMGRSLDPELAIKASDFSHA